MQKAESSGYHFDYKNNVMSRKLRTVTALENLDEAQKHWGDMVDDGDEEEK